MIFWKKKKQPSDDSQANRNESQPAGASGEPESENDQSAGELAQDSFRQRGLTQESDGDLETQTTKETAEGRTVEEATPKVGWFRRALQKTNDLFRTDIRDLWKSEGEIVDEEFLSNLYAILVRTDMGPSMATKIKDSIRDQYRARKVHQEDVLKVIRDRVSESLKSKGGTLSMAPTKPTVILVVGVNGSGKTTSIAKLAHRLVKRGNRVLLAAGDTFRAAAVEQIGIWAERTGAELVAQSTGADPAAVAFDALSAARSRGADVLIADTAGRLQAQAHLMEELRKVRRVLGKAAPGAPHEVLLVLDANQGQNALVQAKVFHEAVGVTGLVLTKLDGTARGGIVLAIARQLGLPIRFIGIGEGADDFGESDAAAFARALVDGSGDTRDT